MESTLQSIEKMESELKSIEINSKPIQNQLKSIWNQFEINLKSIWNQFEINSKSIEINSKSIDINLKSIQYQLKSNWNQFEIDSKSIQNQLESIKKSIYLKSIQNQLKSIQNQLKSIENELTFCSNILFRIVTMKILTLKRHPKLFGGWPILIRIQHYELWGRSEVAVRSF